MLRVRNIFSLVSKFQQIGYFCSAQPPNPPKQPPQQPPQQPPKPPQQPPKPPQQSPKPPQQPPKPPQQQPNQPKHNQSPQKKEHVMKNQPNQPPKQNQQPTQKGQMKQEQKQEHQQEQKQQQKSKSPDSQESQKNQNNNQPPKDQYKSQRFQSSRPPKWQPNQPPKEQPAKPEETQTTPPDEKNQPQKKTLFGFKPPEKPKKFQDRERFEDFDRPRHDRQEIKDFTVKSEKNQPKIEPKKTAVLFQATEETPKTKKVALRQASSRQYNVILRRAQTEIMNEAQKQTLLTQTDTIEDPDKRNEALIEGYAMKKEYLKMDQVFENQKKFNSGVFSTYVVFLIRQSRFRKAKKVLLENRNKLETIPYYVFKQIFHEILNSRLFPVEKASELKFLYKLTESQKIDYDIQEFDTLFLSKPVQPEVVRVFNLYFTDYAAKHKQQHTVILPNLNDVFATAIECLLLEDSSNEVETLIKNLKKLQQPMEKHFTIPDIARYTTYLSQEEGGFMKILDMLKQIKHPNFIYLLEMGLKRLDLVGKQVLTIDKETLENLYLERKDHLPMIQAELFCLLADRIQNYAMIADIFQYQEKNKQKLYSNYIYQKATDVIIDASEGKSVNNAVMAILLEAKERKVQVPYVHFQLAQIKAQIKEGKYDLAYKLYTQNVIAEIILKFQKQKIIRFYVKYIQNQYIGKRFTRDYPKRVYEAKIKSAVRFVDSLSAKALLSMYNKDKSDNLLLEGICGQRDIFEYTKGVARRDLFKKVQTEILNNAYDYTKILDPKTEQERMERDIIDNYKFYVEKEKLFRIAERRRKVITKILRNINMRKLRWRTKAGILREVYKNFPRQKLEQGLLYSELLEFPELELVQQIQIKVQRQSPKQQSTDRTQEVPPVEEPNDPEEILFKAKFSKIQDILHEKPVSQLKFEARQREIERKQDQRILKLKFRKDRMLKLMKRLRKHKRRLSGRGKYRFQRYIQNTLYVLSYYKAKQLEKSLAKSRQAQRRFIQMHYKLTQHEDNLIPVDHLIRLRRPVIKKLSRHLKKQQQVKNVFRDEIEEEDGEQHFLDVPPTLSSLQQMKYIYYNLYSQYDHQIQVPPVHYQTEIWDFIAWGIQHKEPMAVKLGEYYSNLTGQKMPEHLVKMIADFYKYGVGETGSILRNKWLKCLEIINNISTQKLYSHVTDPAFATQIDIEYLMHAEVQQMYKGQARASLATTYSNRKFVRYGVSQRELLL